MIKRFIYIYLMLPFILGCGSEVNRRVEQLPIIFPDYIGVTIPSNIAPMNFRVEGVDNVYAIFSTSSYSCKIDGRGNLIQINLRKWKKLLRSAVGETIRVEVIANNNRDKVAYAPFTISVVEDEVDSHIAYRLIEPGYEMWNRMGIYQRDLRSFRETAIAENTQSDRNCMNCHSFCMQNPDLMMFHMREKHPSTLLLKDGRVERLNTKTPQTMSALVYPSWHPSGKYLAFSVNDTGQAFHSTDPNRVEVYDTKSDVVVYDVENHIIIKPAITAQESLFETFPTFSPDGKRLYFCRSKAHDTPTEFENVEYDLCSVAFDPINATFADSIDTVYKATSIGKSVSFPRVSPDGKYLVFTLSDYGNFSIWHKDADLYMLDMLSGEMIDISIANSNDVESYHSWSSNSRWLVFSSRRVNGLYTMPFFVYIDENGVVHKPFVLPQKSPNFYDGMMKSFNIPEFVKGKVNVSSRKFVNASMREGIDLTTNLK